MRLPFWKMQGAGNDFVMLDGLSRPLALTPDLVRRIADRRLGIGCDQILVVRPSGREDCAVGLSVFNADGTSAGMCGNGARCLLLFLRGTGLTKEEKVRCDAGGRAVTLELLEEGLVRVDMGEPKFAPVEIPFVPEGLSRLSRGADTVWEIRTGREDNWLSVVSMGNPHCVRIVGDAAAFPVEEVARALQAHPAFPEGVNCGFLEVLDAHRARLRVYERGAGETPACGTGACAAAVAGMRRGALKDWVQIECPGGALRVDWAGEGHSVFLTGPAKRVYAGELDLDPAEAASLNPQ